MRGKYRRGKKVGEKTHWENTQRGKDLAVKKPAGKRPSGEKLAGEKMAKKRPGTVMW